MKSGQRTAGSGLLQFAAVAVLVSLAGCNSIQRDPPIQIWWDMKRQAKFKPQGMTGLFVDGRTSRRPVEGTIARGHVMDETPYNTGMEGELYTGKSPVPLTAELIHKGQTKFNTYCTPCHDRTGSGAGIVAIRATNWQPSNLLEDRITQFTDGEIFTIITNGRRTMPAYKYQVAVDDRWAIISYVRVLQRAANSKIDDVPAEMRAELK